MSMDQPRIIRLRSNSVQSLDTWYAMYYKSSRSTIKGQGHSGQIIAVLNLMAMSEFSSEARSRKYLKAAQCCASRSALIVFFGQICTAHAKKLITVPEIW